MAGSFPRKDLAARTATTDARAHRPAIGLRFWAVLWRLALISTLALELLLVLRAAARAQWPPELVAIFAIVYLPTLASVGVALALAGTATMQGLILLILRPLASAWHAPRGPAVREEAAFFLPAGEAVAWECPARRQVGRCWVPGTLFRTSYRIGFHPRAWSAEPWSAAIPEVVRSRAIPANGLGSGLMNGWPERIAVGDRSGQETLFAVADPEDILPRLPAPDLPTPQESDRS